MSEIVGEAVLRFVVDKTGAEEGLRGVEGAATVSGSKSGGAFTGAFTKAVKVGAVGIVAALGLGTALFKVGSTFDDLSDTIQASTGRSGAALAGLTNDAKEVGKNVPLAFSNVGPVIASLNQRLGLAGKPLQDLATQFLDLQDITGQAVDTNAVTGALTQFNVKGADTSKVLDQLFRVTQASGIGFNDLGSILGRQGPVLKQFGFSISDSANLIGTLSKAGLDPTRTLGTLSHAMATFAKAGQDPQKALNDTIGKIQEFVKAGDIAGASNLAGKVFGTRGATQFVAAIQSGRLNMKQLDDLTKGNTSTIIGTTHATEDFGERLQLLKNRVLIGLEPIGTRVFNAIGTAITAINHSGVLPRLETGFKTLGARAVPIFKAIGNGIRAIVPQVLTLGKRALPELQRLGTILLKDVAGAVVHITHLLAPFVVQAVQAAQAFTTGGGLHAAVAVLLAIGGALSAVIGFLDRYGTATRTVLVVIGALLLGWKAYTTALAVQKAITEAYTAVQAAMNVVMDANPIALVVIAIVALAAGFIYAYKHSETFRAGVQAVFGFISTAIPAAIGFVVGFVEKHWQLLIGIFLGPLGIVVGFVIKHFGTIRSVVSSAIAYVVGTARDIGRWAGNIIDDIGKVLGFFQSFPGKVRTYLAGKLTAIGQMVIQDFFDGLSATGKFVGSLASTVKNAVIAAVNEVISALNAAIPNSIGAGPIHVNLPANPIPHLARGTDNWRGGWSWVGEEGPELLNLPRGSQVVPHGQAPGHIDYNALAAALARHGLGRSVTIAPVLPTGDPQAAAMAVFNRLATAGMI